VGRLHHWRSYDGDLVGWERRFRLVSWKYVRWVIIGFSLVSFFSVWYEQRDAFVNSDAALKTEMGKLEESRRKLENKDGQLKALESQIQNQQSTINEALVQLGKAQQQEPFKIAHHPLGPNAARQKPGIAAHDYILLTNRLMTPVRLTVSCDSDIVEAYSRLLGASGLALGGMERSKNNKKQYEIGLSSPAWIPMNPLLVTLYSNQQELNSTFSQR
jgi:hypothetical protein